MTEKAPILQDQEFVIEEGLLYRALRTAAIWMNKAFFGTMFLLAVWLLMGVAGMTEAGCAPSIEVADNGTSEEPSQTCSILLNTTSKYLGAMAVFTFLLSIILGFLGIVVGKRIVEMTPASQEPGAPREGGTADAARPEAEHRRDDGPG